MIKKKVSKKIISSVLVLSLIGTSLHCSATNNIVPVNGGGRSVVVPPSAPVSKMKVDSQSSFGGFSLQSMKSKIDEVINPKKSKVKLRDNPSGTCGDSCFWSFDESTGRLTISGSGEMTSNPWWNDYKNSIKSVILEDGITSIRRYAFTDCSALTNIIIPNSVTFIGDSAFANCKVLTSVNIPDLVTSIGESVFKDCWELESVTFGSSIFSIGAYAFQNCFKLSSVNLGDSIESIDIGAFAGCEALTSIRIIGNGNASIGKSAFDLNMVGNVSSRQVIGLTSIEIGEGVTFIGDRAFNTRGEIKSLTYRGIRDPGKTSNGVFAGCHVNKVIVSRNYEDNMFCGLAIKRASSSSSSNSIHPQRHNWFASRTGIILTTVVGLVGLAIGVVSAAIKCCEGNHCCSSYEKIV